MHRKSTILTVFSLETLIHHCAKFKNHLNGNHKITKFSYCPTKDDWRSSYWAQNFIISVFYLI